MPIDENELLTACENFFESWFGPPIGSPEAMARIVERRRKTKHEFAYMLSRFVKTWQPEREVVAPNYCKSGEHWPVSSPAYDYCAKCGMHEADQLIQRRSIADAKD